MVQKRVILVSTAVAALGLAAAVLGFVSESARSKALVGYDSDERHCVYRRTAAFGCGIAAALLALAGMAIVTAASGCFGCYGGASASGRGRSTAVKLSTIAWMLVAAATVMFLYGAWRNSGGTSGVSRFRSGRRFNRTYYFGCAVVRGGIFATASVASAVATACAVAAYVSLHAAEPAAQGQYYAEPGVAMGQPSYPPPAAPSQFADPGVAMGQPQWAQAYPAAYPPVAYPAPPHHGYGGKPPAGTA